MSAEIHTRRVAYGVQEAARASATEVLEKLRTRLEGLSGSEATDRLGEWGANEIEATASHEVWKRLFRAIANPLVLLLALLAFVSWMTGDKGAAVVMIIMVVMGVTIRFVQETKANRAAAKLKSMIRVTATVVRDGSPQEVVLRELVPGDIVHLSSGDMVPGDIRILTAKDLFITQATLTGESLPVEKSETPDPRENVSDLERHNLCFMGTSVESGSAIGVIVATGSRTHFGKVASAMAANVPETAFDKGVRRFTWLMIRFMTVLVPLVFVINGITKHDWKEAFFFALAIAVGLTPEMFPMIVSVCLSKGALAMSRKKVIVKQLHSIQNFGAMDVLCTDKTGTLTLDRVILEKHVDVFNRDSEEVLKDAYLISHFQTGLKNVLDRAVLKHTDIHQALQVEGFTKLDELPFDFTRRMMSVVVAGVDGQRQLLTKGAPESVFAKCSHFEDQGKIFPMDEALRQQLFTQVDELSDDGFRVLAVATRVMDSRPSYSKSDESNLVLTGYLAFLDPPKDTAMQALEALRGYGVTVKVLTGDNDRVTRKVCREVGMSTDSILSGANLESLTDAELSDVVERHHVFARLLPTHKERIVKALQQRGHVVGFMGDGINDAPALHAADVSISVDNAVDIAKETADLILLEKSLLVLTEGVLEGRKVFVNILKYIRMGASSNFGNMFSVLGASAWLPYVPMAPLQILANNLLYDLSQVPIPTDNVGDSQIAKPRPWDMGEIGKFIVFIGPISSLFDYTTYACMWFLFRCNDLNLIPPAEWIARYPNTASPNDSYAAALFHTGWFVESLMTQTLIVHVIRTNQMPFVHSRASWPLTVATIAVMCTAVLLPFSALGKYLGFVPLPPLYWPLLLLTIVCYLGLTQLVKSWMHRRGWV